MTKPVIPRRKALDDVDAAVAHYGEAAGADTALAFIDALEAAFEFIASFPAAGSPRWSRELNLPDLRAVRVKAFPWLIFYVEGPAQIDVWRVLHAKRDIPAWMADAED
jgi:toxin ParE1/3/4